MCLINRSGVSQRHSSLGSCFCAPFEAIVKLRLFSRTNGQVLYSANMKPKFHLLQARLCFGMIAMGCVIYFGQTHAGSFSDANWTPLGAGINRAVSVMTAFGS